MICALDCTFSLHTKWAKRIFISDLTCPRHFKNTFSNQLMIILLKVPNFNEPYNRRIAILIADHLILENTEENSNFKHDLLFFLQFLETTLSLLAITLLLTDDMDRKWPFEDFSPVALTLYKPLFILHRQGKLIYSRVSIVLIQFRFLKQFWFTHHHHHHHVAPLARISKTLSRYPSLSIIASGRSSRLHSVSAQSCCK